MKKQPYIKTEESEIDSLVVEELFSSSKFQNWLLKKINIKKKFKFAGAWKSFIGKYNECDIVAEFIINNQRLIILIENKICSPEQPKQAERYHKTGKYLIEHKNKHQYITCLLSPKKYFKKDAPMSKYNYKISYEELLVWFKKQEKSKRMKFKQIIIQNGIEKARTAYVQPTDENTNKFYRYYEKLARDFHPELEYKLKAVASGNTWAIFHPKILPPIVSIYHKGEQGYVDLQISKKEINSFSKKYKNKLKRKMSIHKTGKSTSIRIIVPKIPELKNIKKPEKYKKDILIALNSAKQLMEWYLKNI
ncbi:PD-(D/E)XK nuclease family protein [Patescibacteria group bacterium]|nr:PD-(D/E)XK nuclease family protein [Patescibacteria group bacterium]